MNLDPKRAIFLKTNAVKFEPDMVQQWNWAHFACLYISKTQQNWKWGISEDGDVLF